MYEEMSLLNASLVSRLDPRLKADIIIPVSSNIGIPNICILDAYFHINIDIRNIGVWVPIPL